MAFITLEDGSRIEKDVDDGDIIMVDWGSPSAKRCVELFKKKTEKAKIPKGFRGHLGKKPWYLKQRGKK